MKYHQHSLDQYMAQANKFPILSREQELELTLAYQAKGDKRAFNTLINSNLRFVVKVAHKFSGYGLPLEDLVQEGNLGLIRGLEKFQPERGYKLISYAVWWIKAYIQLFVMRNYSLVKIGTTAAQRKLFFTLKSRQADLQARLGEAFTPEALAKELDVTVDQLGEMETRMAFRDYSLNMPTHAGLAKDINNETHQDRLVDEKALEFTSKLERQQISAHLTKLLDQQMPDLNEKERAILHERLMASDERSTLQEIGDRHGISRERVRQIETRLKTNLRKAMRENAEQFI